MKGQKDMVPKIQTTVLRVSIHCEGCKHKVIKLLKKVEGVQKVNIDEEKGKVTVLGDVDPQILLHKLEKSGKHAELWEPHSKVPVFKMNNQFNNFPVGNKKDGFKARKGDNESFMKSGFQAQLLNPKKGPKDLNFLAQKDKKSVKFKIPEEFEEESDFGSGEDDEFGSERSDDGVVASHKTLVKSASHSAKAHVDESKKNGTKKGNGIDKFIKAMLGKSIGKGSSEKEEKKKAKNGTDNAGKEKEGSSVIEVGQVETIKGGKIKIPQMPNPADVAKINGSWKNKKNVSNSDGLPKANLKQEHDNNGQMGSNHGKNFDFAGQRGPFQGMQGAPSYGPMNVPNGPPQFQGFEMGNFNNNYPPHNYNNPQYAQMMMMMNQQRMNQNNYGPPMHHPMMGYGHHQMAADDRYTHMFNDENTGSCSIM